MFVCKVSRLRRLGYIAVPELRHRMLRLSFFFFFFFFFFCHLRCFDVFLTMHFTGPAYAYETLSIMKPAYKRPFKRQSSYRETFDQNACTEIK